MIFDDSILQKLYTSGLQFLTPLGTKELYKKITEEAKELVGGDDAAIFIQNNSSWKPIYSSSRKVTRTIPRNNGYTHASLKKRKAFVITAKDFAKSHPEVVRENIRSVIFIPLFYEKTSLGVLIVRSLHNEEFNDKDLETLKLFGSMATLALHKATMFDEVKHAVETRDLFMAMAAHELRTPLTTMKMYTQFLEKSREERIELPSDVIKKLSLETSRVIHLVNELTLINQIRTGQFLYNWEACEVNGIIKHAIETVQISHPQAIITFVSHISPHSLVIADKEKMLQVFINILNNAVKFSAVNKVIDVSVREEKKNYCVNITDHGEGMAKRDLRHIFKEFYKGRKNYKEGMGLGLYLTKMIVEAHKGRILVTSKINKGTTFTIMLPNEGL